MTQEIVVGGDSLKNLKKQGQSSWKSGILFPSVIFLVVVAVSIAAGIYFDSMSNMQNIDLLRQSARRAVVQCYAIEGAYPPDVEYLEENYGLEYNHEKYFIDYEIFASNIMPNVDVFERE